MEKGLFRLPSIWVFSISTIFALSAQNVSAQADSLNCVLLGKLGFTWNLAGVWGYTDTVGNEYALVGAEDGMTIVNVNNPANPTVTLHIPSAYSLWREIKTWKNYAYVVHDFPFSWNTVPMQGVQIVNLDSLTSPVVKSFRPTFTLGANQDTLKRAHTLWIDENGILYLFGTNIYSGVMIFDVATDPWNPQFLGSFNNFYIHDGFVRDNILYAAAILNGFVAVIDVTLKSNPTLLKTFATPNNFAHNTWLSDDDNTLFTTDEVSGAFIAAYDVTDLNNITELDRIQSLPSTGVIPHNVQVYGDHLVTSYYTRGVHIVDAKYPDLMIEVGYYDTSPNFSGDGFRGAWGAYPYLPSGNILVSDMQEGLHIVQTDYPYGSRIFGIVKDSLTGNTLFGADVELIINNYTNKSAIDGTFKAGLLFNGWDTLSVSLAGYYNADVAVNFTAGQYDTVVVALLPLNFSVKESQTKNFVVYPNPNQGSFLIKLNEFSAATIKLHDAFGRKIFEDSCNSCSDIQVHQLLPSGFYLLTVETNNMVWTEKISVK